MRPRLDDDEHDGSLCEELDEDLDCECLSAIAHRDPSARLDFSVVASLPALSILDVWTLRLGEQDDDAGVMLVEPLAAILREGLRIHPRALEAAGGGVERFVERASLAFFGGGVRASDRLVVRCLPGRLELAILSVAGRERAITVLEGEELERLRRALGPGPSTAPAATSKGTGTVALAPKTSSAQRSSGRGTVGAKP